jgi:tetratricopeptide (TPR) repeat protein
MSVSLTPDIQKLEENVAALRRAALWLASMENDDVTSVVEHEQERRKKPPTLDNMLDALAFTLVRLFDASGQVDALEEAISTYEETLRLRPPGHPRRMISVGALGAALWRSCEKHQRDDARIRRAIDLCREALQAHPLGQPERDIWLNYVAVALQTSFLQQGGLEKLDEAISLHREALTLRSPGHAHRDTTLVNLASACKERFLQLGSPDDLAEAITLYREAVQLHPSGHPSRDVSMDNLADALRISFDNSGEVDVLSEALTMHRAALDLRPIGHPLRGISLNNLGLVLHSTFGQQGGLERLSEAVSLLREALQLHPPGHPYRGTSLNTLAVTLQTMYDHLGGLPVLDEVIALQREALVLRSSGSAEVDVGTSLNNLGNALTASFYQSGRFEDLAEAIALYRSASELRSAGHLNRVRSLNNLAAALKMRYDHIGGSSTLAEALLLYREVVKLHPPRHPDRGSSLSNLSKVLQASYEENREVDVLEEAIALQREALQLHPQGHPLRRNSLRALAMGLRHSVTSGHQSSPEALLEAISLLREDLELSYPEHPMHCLALWGLAMMLRYYDEHTPDAEIWNEAVDNYEQALRFCVPGHSHRARLAAEASKCFLLPSRPESFDFATGTRYVHVALSDNNAPAKVRLRLAASNLPHVMHAYLSILLANAQLAAVADGSSVLDLYRQAIQLLPRAVNFGLYPEARLDVLGDGLEDLSRVGAVCILLFNHDNVAEAVEILEEGRNIFWSQALHLRASGLDGIPDEDRKELQRIFLVLEPATHTVDVPVKSVAQREHEIEARRRLNQEAEALITKIRGYPGLSRFLLPAVFYSIMEGLPDGYVVIVNALSEVRSHALLLSRSSGLASCLELSVPQSKFSWERVKTGLPRSQHLAGTRTNDVTRDDRAFIVSRKSAVPSLENVLASLWKFIACPVLTQLGLQVRTSII